MERRPTERIFWFGGMMRLRWTAAALGSAALVMSAVLVGGGGAAQAGSTGGTLYGWGYNNFGQVGINWVTTSPVYAPLAVAMPADVVQVATVQGIGAAVRADGSVWVWGTSSYVQGDGGPALRPAPHPVAGLPPAAKISLTGDAVFVVGRDGSLWAWGYNNYGELGPNLAHGEQATPVQLVAGGVVDAAVNGTNSAYLTIDGSVWTAGLNDSGGLGNGTLTPRAGFNKAWTPAGVTRLAATGGGFVALRSDGSVWVWGIQYGDTEVAAGRLPAAVPKPTRLDQVTGITQIAAGDKHAVALAKDGTVWTWGGNEAGQLGQGDQDGPDHLTKSPIHLGVTGITQVDAADNDSGAIRSDGMLVVWGWDKGDPLGLGSSHVDARLPTVKQGLFGVSTAVVGGTAFVVATSVTAVSIVSVPSLLGDVNAPQVLHDAGLVEGIVSTVPDDRYCNHLGEIVSQNPAAGAFVVFGSRVDVTVVGLPSQPCF
jgi:alpha-tubulin suppressor-like RCC1 family protein